MWTLFAIIGFVALVASAIYVEFCAPGKSRRGFDPTQDPSTNYEIVRTHSANIRNQTSMF